jgi:YVTN family beta-propeller protein
MDRRADPPSREIAMKFRFPGLLAIAAVAGLLGGAQAFAQNAYITNALDNTVSVIATATNTVLGSPIPVGHNPEGVAVAPDGSKVYVANLNDRTVSVIATATDMVTGAPIPVGLQPLGVAATPDSSKVYVANFGDNTGIM